MEHIAALRAAFRVTRRERPYTIDAIVVLADHLHVIFTLPDGDVDFPARWRRIKGFFTRQIMRADAAMCRNGRGEYSLWQRRFWEHTVRDEQDFARHADYIHYNPVKHGLVSRVRDWPFSLSHAYVRRGWLPEDWGGTVGDGPDLAGEWNR